MRVERYKWTGHNALYSWSILWCDAIFYQYITLEKLNLSNLDIVIYM